MNYFVNIGLEQKFCLFELSYNKIINLFELNCVCLVTYQSDTSVFV